MLENLARLERHSCHGFEPADTPILKAVDFVEPQKEAVAIAGKYELCGLAQLQVLSEQRERHARPTHSL